jgi:hypothetical protein
VAVAVAGAGGIGTAARTAPGGGGTVGTGERRLIRIRRSPRTGARGAAGTGDGVVSMTGPPARGPPAKARAARRWARSSDAISHRVATSAPIAIRTIPRPSLLPAFAGSQPSITIAEPSSARVAIVRFRK